MRINEILKEEPVSDIDTSERNSVTYSTEPGDMSDRPYDLNPKLMTILRKAARDADLRVVIYSGGQDPVGTQNAQRIGKSTRHDHGNAADVWLYEPGSNTRLPTNGNNEKVMAFIQSATMHGARGIGAGEGYMNNVGLHVDLEGRANIPNSNKTPSGEWGADYTPNTANPNAVRAKQRGQTDRWGGFEPRDRTSGPRVGGGYT